MPFFYGFFKLPILDLLLTKVVKNGSKNSERRNKTSYNITFNLVCSPFIMFLWHHLKCWVFFFCNRFRSTQATRKKERCEGDKLEKQHNLSSTLHFFITEIFLQPAFTGPLNNKCKQVFKREFITNLSEKKVIESLILSLTPEDKHWSRRVQLMLILAYLPRGKQLFKSKGFWQIVKSHLFHYSIVTQGRCFLMRGKKMTQ